MLVADRKAKDAPALSPTDTLASDAPVADPSAGLAPELSAVAEEPDPAFHFLDEADGSERDSQEPAEPQDEEFTVVSSTGKY